MTCPTKSGWCNAHAVSRKSAKPFDKDLYPQRCRVGSSSLDSLRKQAKTATGVVNPIPPDTP
jgi:hypothetical protein